MTTNVTSVCGKKPMVVGIADGLGTNTFSALAYATVEQMAKECPNTTMILKTAAGADAQKATSDINSLVAQGANVITVIPDAGPIGPAMRSAMQQGVKVTTWAASAIGATVGPDMVDNLQVNREHDGELFGEFMVKVLKGKGNVIVLGGAAGNSISPQTYAGVEKAFAGHPGMKILNSAPAVTNWDPAMSQQVMSSLLAKYPDVNGVVTEAIQTTQGAVQAFITAHKQLVPMTYEDEPESLANPDFLGSCLYVKYHPTNPDFQVAATSAGTYIGAVALRKAIAAYQGTADNEPSTFDQGYLVNSAQGGSLAPKC